MIDRRMLLLASGAAALASRALAAAPTIHVATGAGCECCDQWVAYLRVSGYAVTGETLCSALLMRFRMEHGVPREAFSCHIGVIEGYIIEGHVPDADTRRLLAERPEAIGLAVPGMPYGSPGMGPETARDAYDVLLIGKDGSLRVFASYPAA